MDCFKKTRFLVEGFVIGIVWADNLVVLLINQKDYEHFNNAQHFNNILIR